jgi:hypothetical protein
MKYRSVPSTYPVQTAGGSLAHPRGSGILTIAGSIRDRSALIRSSSDLASFADHPRPIFTTTSDIEASGSPSRARHR